MKEVWQEIWDGLKSIPGFRYYALFFTLGLAAAFFASFWV
jgi:hypothetical protein